MKKVLLLAAVFTGIIASATPTSTPPKEKVSERVLKAFKETFQHATEITWHEYPEYYQANFKQEEVQVRAQYTDDGTLLKTIRYYGEAQLIPNIVAKLKKKYAGKEIFGVTEVSSSDELTYMINLRDNDHWYIVKSDALGNLQQTEKYNRADK